MSKISARFVSIFLIIVFLAACGGRLAQPVTMMQMDDEKKTCEALTKEMIQNEEEISKLQVEKQAIIKSNIIKGILGPITLGITLFFLDIRGAPVVEANALKKRNDYLYNKVYEMKCKKGK